MFLFSLCRRTLHLDGKYYSELLKTHIIPSVSTDPDIVVCLSTCPNETLSTEAGVNDYMTRTNVSLCRYDITSYVDDDNKCLKPVTPQYVKIIFANKTHVHVFKICLEIFLKNFNLCLFGSNLLSRIITSQCLKIKKKITCMKKHLH